MLLRTAVAALALLVSAEAYAACTQADLKGSWRFDFNTGIVRGDTDRLSTMSCILRIKGNGAIVPGKCTPVDSSGEDGGFLNGGDRKLQMGLNNCEIRISGNSPNFGLQWVDGGGTLTRPFTQARLSISKNKQAMSGWLVNAGKPVISVTAIKRARP